MKSLSIKLFFTFVILAAILYQTIAFYVYYEKSKDGIANLLRENFQSQIINVKHILEKNLKRDNINDIVAILDNFTASSDLLSDLHILNEKMQSLYSTDRDLLPLHENTKCVEASQMMEFNIFDEECYYFTIKFYDKLSPHYYYAYIYTNEPFIDSLFKEHIKTYAIIFSVLTILFLLLLWFSLKNFVVAPLKELKQYAYYSEHSPAKFIIQELESIRYSLKMTFHRMKQEQEKLYTLSTKDPLSGLYNRLSLIEKINWLISQTKRTHEGFTLIFLDLDDFKNINDTYGHDFGDMILKEISMLLKNSLRENDVISRFGGDEFVILLPNITDASQIVNVITKLQASLHKPIEYQELSYNTTSSMGIVIYPKDGDSANTLLKNADIAMYKSKALGKNNYHFFTHELNDELQEKLCIKSLIESALQNNHLKLFYQPQVDIPSGKIIGCEALIRIVDPIEGVISPYKFIPIAEQNNLIVPIGQWVLKEAVAQLKRWENTPFSDLKISINISALELNSSNFIDFTATHISKINPKKLCIELTESVLINNFSDNLIKINELKSLGLTLALDDFGTGYSSLSYLKNIPFDYLKIDKSFIDDILEDTKDKLFIQVIIDIAQAMNLTVIAEGVELQSQLSVLEQLSCDIYQGYYCSKPLMAEEFEKLFLSQRVL